MTEPIDLKMVPMVKNKRVTIDLDDGSFDHLHKLAFREKTSIATLVRFGVLKLLIEDAGGTFTLVPEFQDWNPIHKA